MIALKVTSVLNTMTSMMFAIIRALPIIVVDVGIHDLQLHKLPPKSQESNAGSKNASPPVLCLLIQMPLN
jgi:hypothetical protein